jgi:ABC-type multidrug transport system fused ATPase/permease subunit
MVGVGGYLILKDPHGSFTVGTLLMFRAYWWRLFGPVQTLARVNDMVQRGGAAARRVFEVLDAPEELPDAPDAIAVENIRGADAPGQRLLPLPRRAGTKLPLVLQGVNLASSRPDRRPLRPQRRRQKHRPQSPPALLRSRSPARCFSTAATCAPSAATVSAAISPWCSRRRFSSTTACWTTSATAIRGDDGAGHRRRARRQRPRLHQPTPARLRHQGRRARRPSQRRPKQRISIARAFLANPAVLLLDEPTSSVEPDSEATIIAALDRLMAGRTTVLTSHRPSLINQADWST